jgi:hypothetical protein
MNEQENIAAVGLQNKPFSFTLHFYSDVKRVSLAVRTELKRKRLQEF